MSANYLENLGTVIERQLIESDIREVAEWLNGCLALALTHHAPEDLLKFQINGVHFFEPGTDGMVYFTCTDLIEALEIVKNRSTIKVTPEPPATLSRLKTPNSRRPRQTHR